MPIAEKTPNSSVSAPGSQSGWPANRKQPNRHDCGAGLHRGQHVIGSCGVAILRTHTSVAPESTAPNSVTTNASAEPLPESSGNPASRATPPKLSPRPASLTLEKRSSLNAKWAVNAVKTGPIARVHGYQRSRQPAESDIEEQGRGGGVDGSHGQALPPRCRDAPRWNIAAIRADTAKGTARRPAGPHRCW